MPTKNTAKRATSKTKLAATKVPRKSATEKAVAPADAATKKDSTNKQESASSKRRKPSATPKPKITARKVQESKAFAEARTKAEKYAKDPKKMGTLFEEAAEKVRNANKGPFGETWAYLQAMIRLIRAYANGSYRDIPWASLVLIVLAVIYFVSPVDLIPDIIPVIGLLDDALVVGLALKQVKADLDDFMEWELSNA